MASIQIKNPDGKSAGNGIRVKAINLQSRTEQEETTDQNGQVVFPNTGVRTQIQVLVGNGWQDVGKPIGPFKGHHTFSVS